MPTLGVEVAVIKAGRVLLTLRSDVPFYCLPGGGVEGGETIAQAAKREVYEETGLHVALTRLVGVYSRPDWLGGGDHGVLFTAVPTSGNLTPLDGEVIAMDYYDPDQLPDNLVWWHKQRVFDAFFAETAVAYHQDVRWPLPHLTGQQVRQQMRQGQLSSEETNKIITAFANDRENKQEL